MRTASDMMSAEEKKAVLDDVGEELERSCSTMDGYDEGMIGYWVDPSGGLHAVYDYRKCIGCLVDGGGLDETDAVDHFEYNTMRSLPYVEESKRPIVINMFDDSVFGGRCHA